MMTMGVKSYFLNLNHNDKTHIPHVPNYTKIVVQKKY